MRRFRLTHMQAAMLFESLNSSLSRYVTVLRYELSKNIDAGALRQRINLLAERYEALRTSFVRDADGVIWQEVSDRADIDFSVFDLYTDERIQIHPLNDKLFKLILCQDKWECGVSAQSAPCELVVIFHHALLDGWSMGVIMSELFTPEEPSRKPSPFRYYVKWLGQRSAASDLDWWKKALEGVDTYSELPNVINTDLYERHELRFTIKNSELLRQRASELKITTGRLLQSVWCMLLARYNGGDSVVGTVISGRSAPVPGITEMVGMCINTLPIVTRLPKPPESVTFADWVYKWGHQAAEAEKYGFCHAADLINAPLPHILTIEPSQNDKDYKLKSSNAQLVTNFDVVFTLNDEIKVEFDYNAYAYTLDTVTAIKGHFLTALYAVLENPQIALEQIPILTGAEISELTALNENQEILDIIERKTVADFWYESVKHYANRTALVCADVSFSYAALAKTVDRLSSALRAKGVMVEIPVAIILSRSERYVIAELAVMLAGGFFIPLDPEWPEERIQTILNETKPFIVIDEDAYTDLVTLRPVPDAWTSSALARPNPQNAVYMIMTSGTTGTPKGVVVTHRSLLNFCLWAKERYGWLAGDACAMELGFAFDGSMWDIWLPLISGGTLHVLRDDVRFNISALGDYCREKHITHIDLPVTMADSFREIYRDENTLADLRVMVTGGEEVRQVISAPYPLSNEYGPTECTVCCSVSWINDGDSPITIGSPPPNMNVYVLDGWGRLCPDGVKGEACFSGAQLARGYYNAPDLTAERFVDNPSSTGNPNYKVMYRSGDLMKWNTRNGSRELIFIGRADNQVKINGFRIELGEIESVLRSHPQVISAVAAVREKGEKRLFAYVVLSGTADTMELNRLLVSKLPAFMHPTIVIVDRIPLNTSGKVDYESLPFPEAENISICAEPENESEKILISAISRLLNVESIGRLHNFHELGGNSINAMRIAFRLEREGWLITARELISSVNLAEAAAKMHRTAHVISEKYISKKTFTPLAAQQAMVFLAETVSPALYTVTLHLDAAGISTDELRRRLDKSVGMHDILRAGFERDDNGHIIGCIRDIYEIPINAAEFDASDIINPLRDPLLNIKLHDDRLTIRYHHIALDGWSINLLINELLYNKFPESAASFAEFANRLAAQTERRADDEAWWRKSCQNARTVDLLPYKTTEPEKAEYRRIEICSSELYAKCADAARAARVTPAAFALSAWGIVLNALGAEDGDILIPFAASCRNDDNLMGMCSAVHPLKFSLTDESFGDLARHLQETILDSVSHWFVPQDIIGKLPRYLFVFEDTADGYTASGAQDYDLVIKFSGSGEFIYNADCLPDSCARMIAARMNAALKEAVDDRISVFFDGEYELVTKTFAHGRKLKIKYQTAAVAFAAAADTYAGCVALEADNQSLTYAQAYARARELADELNIRGIGAGDIVAFNLPRGVDGILVQLGIILSGAAFLPLDPEWPKGRVSDILSDSGAAAVIINTPDNGLHIEITGAHGKIPTDSAYVIYTSGTTGRPKGVIISQSALANQIAWAIDEFAFSPADKTLHYVTFTFDPSVWTIFTTLSSGAALSVLPEQMRLDPDAVARHIRERDITICVFPAVVGSEILRRVADSRLRIAFLGGETIGDLPSRTDGLEIVNSYGPTEACINAAFYRIPSAETATRNIGNPVANTSCYVLDAYGEPCPIGIRGELCLGGVQLARGYLNRRSESAAVFVEHPLFGRIYKTGDLAAWNEDGTLMFLGRIDRQVKIRGNRVELGEIENALCRIPEIVDAKVKLAGNALYAYVILREGGEPIDVSGVKQKLSEYLPAYMLPRTITALASFPLTQNGKVDFSALSEVVDTNKVSGIPLSETESAVAAAWRNALSLPPDFIIEQTDSFYDLGGHSLLLFHVVGLLAASGIVSDIQTLIAYPVLGDLANAIGRQSRSGSSKATSDATVDADTYRQYVQQMEKLDLMARRSFRNILITGGTGFLGSHLIHEFYINTDTAIHLPVRGDTKKLRDALVYYFGEQGEEMAASERMRIYQADISAKPPECDISPDAIFHAAADIRHYAPAPEMYRANVAATDNMLAFSSRHPDALFVHISTTSAVNAPFIHECDTEPGAAFENIYQRTKQIAEQHVLNAGKNGLKYAIFRIGHVSLGLENGCVARNWEINAMLRLLHAMLLTELLPEQDYKIGFGYVDKTARAIRLLSSPASLQGLIFHIDNPNALRLSELFKLSGLRGQVLPRHELITRLRRLTASDDELVRQAAAEYLGRLSQGNLEKNSSDITAGEISMDATLLLLKRLNFEWPHVTAEYMKNIISSLKGR